ncbi:MAG: matrixin family metalloprotease, partial [Candidatus Nanoarchaeia archaeon]
MKYSVFIVIGFMAVVLIAIVAINFSLSFTGNEINSNDFENSEETFLDNDIITVPVSVHLVDDRTQQFTTSRNLEDINRIFNEVNRIWSQGQIYFVVSSVDKIVVENSDFNSVLTGNIEILTKNKNFDDGIINSYFARYINANGVSFPAQGFFLVGDITSVNDFRTTSHELGHLLGLRHVQGRENLMFQGANGEILRDWEVEEARRNAKRVYGINV